MDPQPITLSLEDLSGGFEASPDRVRLADLARFTDEVQHFLRGSAKEVDTQALDVAIRQGSLVIQTAPIAAAPRLFADLRSLARGTSLDGIDPRRKEIMQRWQRAALQSGISIKVSAPMLDAPIAVTAASDFHADDADHWVTVERYIRGEIQDLGGATRANAHVKLPNGTTLTVTTEKDLLRNDKVNRLYKMAMLRIKAEFNLLTQELRNARLLEFIEYEPRVDEEALKRLISRGEEAWKDVPDPSAWVDDLRGDSH